jgi:hypothetical protein
MLEMHSFQYDQAHASFGAALGRDPGCAMAAWGDAMAYEHPLWSQRDVAKSRAALARIAREDRLTPKERAYIAAARALFSTADRSAAHKAWLAAAAKMHRDMPGDDEIALQHALALIAVYDELPGHQRELSRAGAIALDVMRRRPGHPGAAHYVIHAFDNPEHAILALPAHIRPARHVDGHRAFQRARFRRFAGCSEGAWPVAGEVGLARIFLAGSRPSRTRSGAASEKADGGCTVAACDR